MWMLTAVVTFDVDLEEFVVLLFLQYCPVSHQREIKLKSECSLGRPTAIKAYPVTLSSALSPSSPSSTSLIFTFFLQARFPFLLPWLCCDGAPRSFFTLATTWCLEEDFSLRWEADGVEEGFMVLDIVTHIEFAKNSMKYDQIRKFSNYICRRLFYLDLHLKTYDALGFLTHYTQESFQDNRPYERRIGNCFFSHSGRLVRWTVDHDP
jgi:hypothetical protein